MDGAMAGDGIVRRGAFMTLYNWMIDNAVARRIVGVYLPAVFFGMAVIAKVSAFIEAGHLSGDPLRELHMINHLLSATFLAAFVVLLPVRLPVKGRMPSGWAFLAAFGGSFSLTAVAVAPLSPTNPAVVKVAVLFLLTGLLWSIVSLLTLGRCFGILPEARGLVTRGPYRLVRHPVYFGEIIGGIGLVLPAFSLWTVLAFCAFVALQLWRTRFEELALVRVFPEYGDYARKTRRVIPGIW